MLKKEHPNGLKENLKVAKRGGTVSKMAREFYESETGDTAIKDSNNLTYEYDDVKKISNK